MTERLPDDDDDPKECEACDATDADGNAPCEGCEGRWWVRFNGPVGANRQWFITERGRSALGLCK